MEPFELHFPSLSPAEATIAAEQLKQDLAAIPELVVGTKRASESTMDTGTVVTVAISLPAVYLVGKSHIDKIVAKIAAVIETALLRDSVVLDISRDGSVKASGISSGDAVRIVEAIRKQ